MQELTETYYLDFNSSEIQNIIAPYKKGTLANFEKIRNIYLAIRNGWYYNPFCIYLKPEAYKASYIANKKKAIV